MSRSTHVVTFDTSSAQHYEFVHGRRPRGFGSWIFRLHRAGASTQFECTGSFTTARQEAMREARQLGCDTVTVES